MKNPYSTVQVFNIDEISTDAGRLKPTKDFHVVLTEELPLSEKIFRPTRTSYFTIALVTAGQATLQSNLIKYPLHKNSLFIIPPDVVYQFNERTEDAAGILLQFTKEFLGAAELHKKHVDVFTFFSSQSDPQLSLTENEAETMRRLLLFLREKDLFGEEHPYRDEVIHHSFNLLMFEMGALFRKYRKEGVVKLTRKEELLMSFVKLLAKHFKEERSVLYYAHQLFVTPKHLTKTVKELTNKTAGEFIDEMVISEAKILLDDPAMSIGNVADELNFSDQFFFSKFFKHHTSVNPSEYRTSF